MRKCELWLDGSWTLTGFHNINYDARREFLVLGQVSNKLLCFVFVYSAFVG